MTDLIYLDHAATTPVDPIVLRAMEPYFSDCFGNPSSMYALGQVARTAIDEARLRAARVLGCDANEVIFTGGATESDNLAIRGVAWAARIAASDRQTAPHIITSAIEHHAILYAARDLVRQGFSVTYVEPDRRGVIDPNAIAEAVRPETCLVSIMYANNETGAIQPLHDVVAAARSHGVPVHTDAVQAAGLLPLNVDDLGIDLLSLSAHKFYGPKGVGLLYVRRGTAIDFQQLGGGQEQGRRGGTENVPGIVGLGHAFERAEDGREVYVQHCATLRDRLMEGMLRAIPDATINGPLDGSRRLANNLNITIPGIDGETLLVSLDMLGVAASAGSACTTGNTEPSHVLLAMGLTAEECRSTLRFSVGRGNTEAQIDTAITAVAQVVSRARSRMTGVL